MVASERGKNQWTFSPPAESDGHVPVGTVAGAGAAVVVCWAGWGRPRSAWVRAGPASSSWGNPVLGPSGQAWDGSLALAWLHWGSPFGQCGMVGDQTAGCTWGAFGLSSWRGPGGTAQAQLIGSEMGSHRHRFLKMWRRIKWILKTKSVLTWWCKLGRLVSPVLLEQGSPGHDRSPPGRQSLLVQCTTGTSAPPRRLHCPHQSSVPYCTAIHPAVPSAPAWAERETKMIHRKI